MQQPKSPPNDQPQRTDPPRTSPGIPDADAGRDLAAVLQALEVAEATYCRWRNQYGGMKAAEAKKLRELEVENARLKKLLTEAELDKATLKELASGNWRPLQEADRRRTSGEEIRRVAAAAADRDLAVLGEADYGSNSTAGLPPGVRDTLRAIARDRVEAGQYLDFLKNRSFRRTLLVHQSAEPTAEADPKGLLSLRVASPLRPDEGESGEDAAVYRRGRASLRTGDPLMRAAAETLRAAWPRRIPLPADPFPRAGQTPHDGFRRRRTARRGPERVEPARRGAAGTGSRRRLSRPRSSSAAAS